MEEESPPVGSIMLRLFELLGLSLLLWAGYELWTWRPSGLMLDLPDNALGLAGLSLGVFFTCMLARLCLSLRSRCAQVEFFCLLALVLAYPMGCLLFLALLLIR